MYKKKNRNKDNLVDTLLDKELSREYKLQQRLKEVEDKKILQMEKIEKKKKGIIR